MVNNNDGDNWSTSPQWTTFKAFFHIFWITAYYVMGYGIHIIFNIAITDGRPLKSISSLLYETDFSNTEQMLYALVHMLILSRMLHYVDKALIRPTLNAVLDQYPFIYYLSNTYFWIFFLTSVFQIFSTFYGRFHIAIDLDNCEEYPISYCLKAFLSSFVKESPANKDVLHFQEARNTAHFFLSFLYIMYFVDTHAHNNEVNEAISRIPLNQDNVLTLTAGLFSNLSFFVVSTILSFASNAFTYLLFNTTAYNDFGIVFISHSLGTLFYTFEEKNHRSRFNPTDEDFSFEGELTKRRVERAKSLLVDQIAFIVASFLLVCMFFQADGYIYAADARAAGLVKGVTYSDNYWQVYSVYSLYQATAGLCTYTGTKVLLRVYDVTVT